MVNHTNFDENTNLLPSDDLMSIVSFRYADEVTGDNEGNEGDEGNSSSADFRTANSNDGV